MQDWENSKKYSKILQSRIYSSNKWTSQGKNSSEMLDQLQGMMHLKRFYLKCKEGSLISRSLKLSTSMKERILIVLIHSTKEDSREKMLYLHQRLNQFNIEMEMK